MTSNNQFLANYKVINKIGEGSFSEVLKCQDRKTGCFFAAKVLRKTFKMSEQVLDCAEVVALRKILPHPNILNPLEYYYDDSCGRLILIFDLMDMSLYDLMKIKKRGFPEHKARFYLHEVLKGLYHLHKMGLFHRDVKPENILINLPKNHSTLQYSFQERVKLADLGSIRGIYSKPPYTEYISTRWYRAPECLLTKGYYGPKMDIWAAGCVFYELVTLTPLFAGSNEIDQLAKIHSILGTPPVRVLNKFTHKSQNFQNFPKQRGKGLNSVLESLSDSAKNVVRLMLEYDPMKRVTLKRLLEHSYFGSLTRINNMKLSDKMSAPVGTKRKQQSSEDFIKDSRKRTIKSFSLCMHSVPKKVKVNSS